MQVISEQEKYHGTRSTLELNFVKKVEEKNEGKNIHTKQNFDIKRFLPVGYTIAIYLEYFIIYHYLTEWDF